MAFQPEPYRILAGSLNILPPTDKAPPEDSIELTNFRVDQAGQLLSRRGISPQSAAMGLGRGHTLFRHSPNRRFLGVGPKLYGGEGDHSYPELASGFDGQMLGMEAMDGHTWVMNQAKQGKTKYGGAFTSWLPDPPAAALTAAAGVRNSVTLATFDTGEAWTVTDPAGVTAAGSLDSAEKISGQSLALECNPPGTWSADLGGLSINAAIGGAQQAHDKFRIWVFCGDPAAVSSIQILVDVNTGGFDLDYYSVYVIGASLNQGARSWTQLEISREASSLTNQQLSDGAHVFVRNGETVGKDWQTVRAIRITVKTHEACDVQFDTFDVIGGLNSGTDGEYTFFVTFDTADGHETNPSPESLPITVDHQAIALSGIPTSTDATVTKRHIYMSGGSLAGPLRVATIGDNATTTYSLLTADDVAQSLNSEMPFDHDPPPAARGLIWHLGKLIAFNSLEHPGRYWWTATGQPWYFPGSDDDAEGNWQDSAEDQDEILRATSHGRTLLFYTRRAIVKLYGDPSESDPEATSATIGLVGPGALCKVGALDYLVGAEGIYAFNGETETKISFKIDPIFRGETVILTTVAGVQDLTVPPMSQDAKETCVLGHINGRLYFSYASTSSFLPDITLVCELATGRWSQMKLLATPTPDNGLGGFTAFYYEGQDRGLTAATTNIGGGQVHVLESGLNDNQIAIPLAWMSCYHDQGFPDNPKVYGELVITHRTGKQGATSPLTVALYFNNGSSSAIIGTLNSDVREMKVFPLTAATGGFTANNVAIRISGNATTECAIYDAYIYWYIEARNGKSFDSGVIDLGSDLAKELDQIELDFTGSTPGAATYYLRSDLPGGAMAARTNGTVPVLTTRQNLRKALTVTDGRKVRLIVIGTEKFQLHGLKLRMTEIAEYVDGSKGETYLSPVVNF